MKQKLLDAGYEVREYRANAYAAPCLSVTLARASELVALGGVLGDMAGRPCLTDSMGKELVVYWPSETP